MGKNNSMLITNIVVLIAGLILIILHGRVNIVEEIIVILGIMFTIPSVFSLVLVLIKKNREQNKNNYLPAIVSSIGGLVFGLFLMVNPNIFMGLLSYLFAGLLIIGGLYHIIFLTLIRRKVKMPLWFFILPSLIVIAGVGIIFTDIRTLESIIVLITGISMICFAINSLLEYIGMRTLNNRKEINQ